MPATHCALCAVYEKRVMTKALGEALPPEVVPCPQFVMSDAFREWAVSEMRKEVMGQVAKAGLDRMALVKGPAPGTPANEPAQSDRGLPGRGQSHQSRNR